MIESGKLLDILHNYNKFWMTGQIESGVRRDILDACVRQLDSREILLLKGIRRSGKSTLKLNRDSALLMRELIGRCPYLILACVCCKIVIR
jgi:predicted AAA+ superfamily ATPase